MTYEPTYYAQEINMTQFLEEMRLKEQQRSFQIKRGKKVDKAKPIEKARQGLQSFLLQTL